MGAFDCGVWLPCTLCFPLGTAKLLPHSLSCAPLPHACPPAYPPTCLAGWLAAPLPLQNPLPWPERVCNLLWAAADMDPADRATAIKLGYGDWQDLTPAERVRVSSSSSSSGSRGGARWPFPCCCLQTGGGSWCASSGCCAAQAPTCACAPGSCAGPPAPLPISPAPPRLPLCACLPVRSCWRRLCAWRWVQSKCKQS